MEAELLRHVLRRPVTVLYPFEASPPAEGLRGRPHIDMCKCIGCGLCARGCPSRALEMDGRKDQATFRIHLDRCLFCGQCAASCPREAIELTPEFELATSERAQLVLRFDRASQEA
jgi:formate hydrogenlyase subunit 6/NADH:ubiquinone oxidoreductase subunit I